MSPACFLHDMVSVALLGWSSFILNERSLKSSEVSSVAAAATQHAKAQKSAAVNSPQVRHYIKKTPTVMDAQR